MYMRRKELCLGLPAQKVLKSAKEEVLCELQQEMNRVRDYSLMSKDGFRSPVLPRLTGLAP
jgi:hypothetical protein